MLPFRMIAVVRGQRTRWFLGRFWLLAVGAAALLALLLGALGAPWWPPALLLPALWLYETSSGLWTRESRRHLAERMFQELFPDRSYRRTVERMAAMRASAELRPLELAGWKGRIVEDGWSAGEDDRVTSVRLLHLAPGQETGGIEVLVDTTIEDRDERLYSLSIELDQGDGSDRSPELRALPGIAEVDGLEIAAELVQHAGREAALLRLEGRHVQIVGSGALPRPLRLVTGRRFADYPSPE